MDPIIMNLCIQKLLKVYHIQRCYFDDLLDLYAELMLDIHKDKIHYEVLPSEHTLLEKLFWKFANFQDKANRHQNKIQQMLREELHVE